MNKIILTVIVSLFIFSCKSESNKNEEAFAKGVMQACESTSIHSSMSEDQKRAFKSYCSCSVDKMVGEFTLDEMKKINNASPELQERVAKLTAPCVKELEIELEKIKK